MPHKQKIQIVPGDKFGSLTVLSEEGRANDGHLQYAVKCDCGKQYIVRRGNLLRPNPRCRECAEKTDYRFKDCKYHLWEIVGNRLIISEPERNENGIFQAEMMCLNCGGTTVTYPGELKSRKRFTCEQCPPNYYFRVNNGIATGVLPDGKLFMIDSKDIERVSKYRWHYEKDGYIISSHSKPAIRLHNFILNDFSTENNRIHVDHINRNPLDCRKSNLRIVTAQQNSMNKSRQKNNTTGFVGVTLAKSNNRYRARIGLNDKRIYLGTSCDPVICAQMYNWAAEIIFGEFAGELNDVPEPSADIKHQVEEKCKPFISEAKIAKQRVGFQ